MATLSETLSHLGALKGCVKTIPNTDEKHFENLNNLKVHIKEQYNSEKKYYEKP